MDKKDIIKLLTAYHYYYKEINNEIDVRIVKGCYLSLFFQNDSLVSYREKIKKGFWWVTLCSMFRYSIIVCIVLLLLAILYNFYFDKVPILTMNAFFVIGIVNFIAEMCYYFFILSKLKSVKRILHLSE